MDAHHFLRAAMLPRSIAVVGASERPGSPGAYLWSSVLAGGFKGDAWAVNPKYSELSGRPCFSSLSVMPGKVDLAVITTRPPTVAGIIKEAGERGIPFALVLSGDFTCIGEQGLQWQTELLEVARKAGVRLIGPSSVGLMRPGIGLNASFSPVPIRAGSLGLVSQSGTIASSLLDFAWTAGFGFSSVVSTGAGRDIDFPEVLDFLAVDGATRAILVYVEGVHDARAFLSSLRAAASVKPVIVLKAGRYLTGAQVVMSHTGALVGNDQVFDAALRRGGAIRVSKIAQLFAAAEAFASNRLPQGDRLAVLTNGGGPGALAADAVAENQIQLARLSRETAAGLDALLPAPWPYSNPVDISADADAGRYTRSLELLLEDKNNDGVLVMYAPTPRLSAETAAHALLPLAQASEKPVITVWLGEKDAGRGRAVFKGANLPALINPERGVEAFGFLSQYVRNRALRLQVPPPLADELRFDVAAARRIVEQARARSRHVLYEQDSKSLLACFGIETAVGVFAPSAAEARDAALTLGFPVVLKVRADGVVHKSDVGGVLLNLRSAVDVEDGFALVEARVAERAPHAKFLGVLVQKMIERPHGRELIVGLSHDPTFGPVMSFGMGGLATEIFRDAAVALPPLNRFLALDMISRTRVAKMLDDFRGAPAVDIDKLVEVLLRVSELACSIPAIRELDINPLLADENGVIALDARVVVSDAPLAPDAIFSHLAIHPYPRSFEREVPVKGATLRLRPIRPEDAEMEMRFVARLSPRTSYLRFHSPVRELTRERLVRFTQIDYDREMAFVAVDSSGDEEELRGVSRYTCNPDGRSAEFGVIVEDAWQRRGLGHVLMDAIETTARNRGLERLIGYVLKDNDEMGVMMGNRGYQPHRDEDDPGVLAYILDLTAPVAPVAMLASPAS
ncbi:MAG: bifunctional acetate--CoA ligase family protein/GNAT family N-acetyltransferase [Burkholderiaceae bacterium]